jgi:hypothetical protein
MPFDIRQPGVCKNMIDNFQNTLIIGAGAIFPKHTTSPMTPYPNSPILSFNKRNAFAIGCVAYQGSDQAIHTTAAKFAIQIGDRPDGSTFIESFTTTILNAD